MTIWTKDYAKYREQIEQKFRDKYGNEWIEKNKARLDYEWEYFIEGSTVKEDPHLPIEGLSATEEELEEMGLQKGIDGRYHPASLGPIVRENPTHNSCMNAWIRGYIKHMKEERKKGRS